MEVIFTSPSQPALPHQKGGQGIQEDGVKQLCTTPSVKTSATPAETHFPSTASTNLTAISCSYRVRSIRSRLSFRRFRLIMKIWVRRERHQPPGLGVRNKRESWSTLFQQPHWKSRSYENTGCVFTPGCLEFVKKLGAAFELKAEACSLSNNYFLWMFTGEICFLKDE